MGLNLKNVIRKLNIGDRELMNMPMKYWDTAMFDKIPDGSYKDAVRNYLENFNHMMKSGIGLLLYGIHGRGKTSIACVVAKVARMYEKSVYFSRASELRDKILKYEKFDDGVTILERVKRVDLLIIDDLSKETKGSEYNEGFWEDLIRIRADNYRATIITSNLDKDGLTAFYRESMISVMTEMIVPIEIGGIDYRNTRAEEIKKVVLGGILK